MKIRVAGFENDSIVDGPGFRLAVFTQGCPHHCPGCHNPETHPFEGGQEVDTERIVQAMKDNPLLDGLTLSGGEPFCQPEPCAELARATVRMPARPASMKVRLCPIAARYLDRIVKPRFGIWPAMFLIYPCSRSA